MSLYLSRACDFFVVVVVVVVVVVFFFSLSVHSCTCCTCCSRRFLKKIQALPVYDIRIRVATADRWTNSGHWSTTSLSVLQPQTVEQTPRTGLRHPCPCCSRRPLNKLHALVYDILVRVAAADRWTNSTHWSTTSLSVLQPQTVEQTPRTGLRHPCPCCSRRPLNKLHALVYDILVRVAAPNRWINSKRCRFPCLSECVLNCHLADSFSLMPKWQLIL